MDKDEMIMLSAASIYAGLLVDIMREKQKRDLDPVPSVEWSESAMDMAVYQAELLWRRVLKRDPN